jgi:hypothetical protein
VAAAVAPLRVLGFLQAVRTTVSQPDLSLPPGARPAVLAAPRAPTGLVGGSERRRVDRAQV